MIWQELCEDRSPCISLWELDPEAVHHMCMLRAKLCKACACDAEGVRETPDSAVVFDYMLQRARRRGPSYVAKGQLDLNEFRKMAADHGLTISNADRVFNCINGKA